MPMLGPVLLRPAPPRSFSAMSDRLYRLALDFALSEGCTVRKLPRVHQGLEIARDGTSVRVEVAHPDELAASAPGRVLVRSLEDLRGVLSALSPPAVVLG